jgi:hypothetical protein
MKQISVPLDASRDVLRIEEGELHINPLKFKLRNFPREIKLRDVIRLIELSIILSYDVHIKLSRIQIGQGVHFVQTCFVPGLIRFRLVIVNIFGE